MLRIASAAVLGIALALPLSAFAKSPIDQKAPQATVVAASEDAVIVPAPPSEAAKPSENKVPKHSERRGSNQSLGEFRFTNPYAFPIQTLPVVLPSVTAFSF